MNKIHGGNIYEIAKRHDLNPAEIIDFSASINPLGLSPKAKRKILKEGLSAILHYPDPQCAELRQALAQFHGLEKTRSCPGPGPPSSSTRFRGP